MNCKQGDLAIVVRSPDGVNLGKIVRCIRFIGMYHGCPDVWETDRPLEWRDGRGGDVLDCASMDSYMRPLRGDLLNNETETGRELVHAR